MGFCACIYERELNQHWLTYYITISLKTQTPNIYKNPYCNPKIKNAIKHFFYCREKFSLNDLLNYPFLVYPIFDAKNNIKKPEKQKYKTNKKCTEIQRQDKNIIERHFVTFPLVTIWYKRQRTKRNIHSFAINRPPLSLICFIQNLRIEMMDLIFALVLLALERFKLTIFFGYM